MDHKTHSNPSATDRRSFLKTGALLAAPVAAIAPVAALAEDGSRTKLARLEDERAIEALHRSFLRHVNGSGDRAALVTSSDAIELDDGLRSIIEHPGHEPSFELADDGLSARSRCTCRVELETEFTGDSTIEQMARLQGQGSRRHSEERVLATKFVKSKHGWRIARVRFA